MSDTESDSDNSYSPATPDSSDDEGSFDAPEKSKLEMTREKEEERRAALEEEDTEGTNPICEPIPPQGVPLLSREEIELNKNIAYVELAAAEFRFSKVPMMLANVDKENLMNDTANLDWAKGGTCLVDVHPPRRQEPANPVIDQNTGQRIMGEHGFFKGLPFNDTSVLYNIVAQNSINAPLSSWGKPRIKGMTDDSTGNFSIVTNMRNSILEAMPDAVAAKAVCHADIHLHATEEIGKVSKQLGRYMKGVQEGKIDANSKPQMELAWKKHNYDLCLLERIRRETAAAQKGESTIGHLQITNRGANLLDEGKDHKYYRVAFRCNFSNCYADEVRQIVRAGTFKDSGIYISEFDISCDWACYVNHAKLLKHLVETGQCTLQKNYGHRGERLGFTSGSRLKAKLARQTAAKAELAWKKLQNAKAARVANEAPADHEADEAYLIAAEARIEQKEKPQELEDFTSVSLRSMLDSPWFHADPTAMAQFDPQLGEGVKRHKWESTEQRRRFVALDNANYIGAQCTSFMYTSSSTSEFKFGPEGKERLMPQRGKPNYGKDPAQFEHASNANKVEPGSHTLGQAAAMFNRTQRAACSDTCLARGHSRTEVTLYFTGLQPDEAHMYMYSSLEHMYATLDEWNLLVPSNCVIECPRETVFENYWNNIHHIVVSVDSRTDYAHLAYSFNSQTNFVAGSVVKHWSSKYRFVLQECAWGAKPIDVLTVHRGGIGTTAEQLAADAEAESEEAEVQRRVHNRAAHNAMLLERGAAGTHDIRTLLQRPRASAETSSVAVPVPMEEDPEMQQALLESMVVVGSSNGAASSSSAPLPLPLSSTALGKRKARTPEVAEEAAALPSSLSSTALGKRRALPEVEVVEEQAAALPSTLSSKALGKRKAPIEVVEEEEEDEEDENPDLDNAGGRDTWWVEDEVVEQEEEEEPPLPDLKDLLDACKTADEGSTVDPNDFDPVDYKPGWVSCKEAGGALVTSQRFVPVPLRRDQFELDGRTFIPETRLIQGDQFTGIVFPKSNVEVERIRARKKIADARKRGEETDVVVPPTLPRKTEEEIQAAELEDADWEAPPGWNRDNTHQDDVGERALYGTNAELAAKRLTRSGMEERPEVPFRVRTYPHVPLKNAKKDHYRVVSLRTALPPSAWGLVAPSFKAHLKPTHRALANHVRSLNAQDRALRDREAQLSGRVGGDDTREISMFNSLQHVDEERNLELKAAFHFCSTANAKSRLFDIGKECNSGKGISTAQLPVGAHKLICVLELSVVDPKYACFIQVQEDDKPPTIQLFSVTLAVARAIYMWTPDLLPLYNVKATPRQGGKSYNCYLSPSIDGVELFPIGDVVCHGHKNNGHGKQVATLTLDIADPVKSGEKLHIVNAGTAVRKYDSAGVKTEMDKILAKEIEEAGAAAAASESSDAGRSSVDTRVEPPRRQIQLLLTSTTKPMLVPTDSHPERVKLPPIAVPTPLSDSEFRSVGTMLAGLMDKKELIVVKLLQLNTDLVKIRRTQGIAAKIQLLFPNGPRDAISKGNSPTLGTCYFPMLPASPHADLVALHQQLKQTSIVANVLLVTKATANSIAAVLVPEADWWWRRIEAAQPLATGSAYAELVKLSKGMPDPPEDGSIIVDAVHRITRGPDAKPLLIRSLKTGQVYGFSLSCKLDFEKAKLPCKFNVAKWELECGKGTDGPEDEDEEGGQADEPMDED